LEERLNELSFDLGLEKNAPQRFNDECSLDNMSLLDNIFASNMSMLVSSPAQNTVKVEED